MNRQPTKPKRTHLELTSGRYLDYTDPQPEDISLSDISLALSNSCRWGGHCEPFYSIAEHACLVHDIVAARSGPPHIPLDDPWRREILLAALHHDDHEAFVGDMPTPLKNLLGTVYYDIADRLDEVIAAVMDIRRISDFKSAVVKRADATALHLEAERFKPSGGKTWEGRPEVVELPDGVEWACGLSPADARSAYLARHEALLPS